MCSKLVVIPSVATGLFEFSPDFVSKKTQKNPGIENYIQSSKIKGFKHTAVTCCINYKLTKAYILI